MKLPNPSSRLAMIRKIAQDDLLTDDAKLEQILNVAGSGKITGRPTKRVRIQDVIYPSLQEAALAYGLKYTTARHRCLSKNPNFSIGLL